MDLYGFVRFTLTNGALYKLSLICTYLICHCMFCMCLICLYIFYFNLFVCIFLYGPTVGRTGRHGMQGGAGRMGWARSAALVLGFSWSEVYPKESSTSGELERYIGEPHLQEIFKPSKWFYLYWGVLAYLRSPQWLRRGRPHFYSINKP
jgi:hypothetical protein